MSLLVPLALCALLLADCSKDRAAQPPATERPTAEDGGRPEPFDTSGRSTSAREARPSPTFVVELEKLDDIDRRVGDGIERLEGFVTADKVYAIYRAESADVLVENLAGAGISARKVTEVRDINSPTRGGGEAARDRPLRGHRTFVIERNMPGVGSFPEERKQAISKRSNAAVREIGDSIEWDHSYLTDEGTYCIYRATDEAQIRQHGAITGAPMTIVSEVKHLIPTP